MAHLPLFRSQKLASPNPASAAAAAAVAATAAVVPIDGAASAAGKQCLPCSGGIGRRLVRKLKKQSKMLRSAAAGCATAGGEAATFQCQYDPLSYSRNFDGCCELDDDSSYSYYTFSSRFARPLAAAASSR